MIMRLASLETDSWQLRSGDESHAASPDTFLLPPLERRENLARGQAARLIFDILTVDENGQKFVQGERIWVIVAEKLGDYYIGILDNPPTSIEPSDEVYLCFGAEIPFQAEHVIDIADPPEDYSNWQLSQAAERVWPRDTEGHVPDAEGHVPDTE